MKQFLKIILMNAWGGLKRANGLSATILVMMGACLLLVGSGAAASDSRGSAANGLSYASVPHVSDMLARGLPSPVNDPKIHKHHHRSLPNDVASPNTMGLSEPSGSPPPSIQNQSSGNPNGQVTAAVQLAPPQMACQQGTLVSVVPSATVTLPSPLAADGTFDWYWEARIDSGTDSSEQSPLPAGQSQQAVTAGSIHVVLPPVGSSQPLLTAPVSADYGYSFRLHLSIGQADVTSAWQSVPQTMVANSSCQQG